MPWKKNLYSFAEAVANRVDNLPKLSFGRRHSRKEVITEDREVFDVNHDY